MISSEFVKISDIVEIGIDDAAVMLTGSNKSGRLTAKQEVVRIRRIERKWRRGGSDRACGRSKTDQFPVGFQT